jgi:hypothetical protein
MSSKTGASTAISTAETEAPASAPALPPALAEALALAWQSGKAEHLRGSLGTSCYGFKSSRLVCQNPASCFSGGITYQLNLPCVVATGAQQYRWVFGV